MSEFLNCQHKSCRNIHDFELEIAFSDSLTFTDAPPLKSHAVCGFG